MSKLELVDARLRLILKNIPTARGRANGGISAFVEDNRFSLDFKSAIIFLAVYAKYPDLSDLKKMKCLLGRKNSKDFLKYVFRHQTLNDRKRILVPSNEVLVDVTRYWHTTEISGIPRVVGNLLTSGPFQNATLGVWTRRVYAPIKIHESSGRHLESKGSEKTLYGSNAYVSLRRLYMNHSHAIQKLRAFSSVLVFLNKIRIHRWLLDLTRINSPSECLIISPKQLVIPEILDKSNSEIMMVWLQNVGVEDARALVHDVLPLSHPEYFPKHSVSDFKKFLPLLSALDVLHVGTPILANDLRQALYEFPGDFKINILPLPVTSKHESSAPSHTPNNTFAFIGGFQKRKGLEKLVDFFDTFDNEKLDFQVTVVGKVNHFGIGDEGALHRLVSKKPEIFNLAGYLSDGELFRLISESTAVLYLSELEGYGLPVLESLALGVPVIGIDSPVNRHFQSFYGGIHLISPDFHASVLDILNEISSRGELWQKLKTSIRFENIPREIDEWAYEVLKA
ncbi:MAG: glycosyltransferase [Candidatus Planktophila sp.]